VFVWISVANEVGLNLKCCNHLLCVIQALTKFPRIMQLARGRSRSRRCSWRQITMCYSKKKMENIAVDILS